MLLPVMPSWTNSTVQRTQDCQDGTNDNQDDPDCHEYRWYVEQGGEQYQDDPEDDHASLLNRRALR